MTLNVFIFTLILGVVAGVIRLEKLSTIYLPYSYEPVKYEYNQDVAEQSSYHAKSKTLFTVGNDLIHSIDISKPYSPTVTHYTRVANGELTDIEVCDDKLAVTWDNKVDPIDGKVFVYHITKNGELTLWVEVTVGAVPDMLQWTPDCKRLVVAVEGEMRFINGQYVDPEGSVAVIHIHDGQYELKRANFSKFNDLADYYVSKGVRWVYRRNGSTFAQDLEPEYVALNKDGKKAYISLQENNAVAVMDVEKAEILELYGLGSKSWANLSISLDETNHLSDLPLHSLYQPDTIKFFEFDGEEYILTANEGEEKEYEKLNFTDGISIAELIEKNAINDGLKGRLNDDDRVGRLRVSSIDGLDENGLHETLHAYGARSYSIRRASDLSLIYDSGDDIEKNIRKHIPFVLGSNGKEIHKTPEGAAGSRSAKKGPETENVDVGRAFEKTLLFVANERPGVILIYSFDRQLASNFESIHYAGGQGRSWLNLYENRETADVDPEDIKFIPEEQSPLSKPMLIVSGTTSGTVSCYQVVDDLPEEKKEFAPTPSVYFPHFEDSATD